MTNQEWLNLAHERLTHSDTMVAPTALEMTWMQDMDRHRESLSEEEREVFDTQDF